MGKGKKMLITSNFSFSQCFQKTLKNQALFGKGLIKLQKELTKINLYNLRSCMLTLVKTFFFRLKHFAFGKFSPHQMNILPDYFVSCETSHTIFFLINSRRAMQNTDRELLFCIQFAKQKVCLILYIIVF